MKLTLAAAILAIGATAALAHGDAEWIQRGSYEGPDGVHCCGVNDCHRLALNTVKITAGGYAVEWRGRTFTIPFSQAQLSENEDFWICEKSDFTPRCFFAPPVGS